MGVRRASQARRHPRRRRPHELERRCSTKLVRTEPLADDTLHLYARDANEGKGSVGIAHALLVYATSSGCWSEVEEVGSTD